MLQSPRHASMTPIVLALGLTQIIGYGTLYYSFGTLAPEMAETFGLSVEWLFGALSASLLVSGLVSPISGRLADRFGAARLMTYGSLAGGLSLAFSALAPDALWFTVGLLAAEIATCFIFYGTAFTLLVQAGGAQAQRSNTHLTLIAGFASSLFWPLTTWLHGALSWREVLLLYAALHVLVCLPVHWALARLTPDAVAVERRVDVPTEETVVHRNGSLVFLLMLLGFAIEGYALSAMLVHIVPLTQALGLGAAGLVVASLFGPAQVASRLVNLIFGGGLSQVWLAVIAAVLMPIGIVILLATTPSFAGAVVFAILMGLGSGLTSIVGGTLPLELFGRRGYGSRLGWSTSAKQLTSALAPFAMSMSMAGIGVPASLWVVVAAGLLGAAAFALIAFVPRGAAQQAIV
jgi:MFS family permease